MTTFCRPEPPQGSRSIPGGGGSGLAYEVRPDRMFQNFGIQTQKNRGPETHPRSFGHTPGLRMTSKSGSPSLCSGCCAITSFKMTTLCRPEPPQGSRSIPGHRDRLRMTIRCRPEARSPVFCRPETGVLGFCHPEGCFFVFCRPETGVLGFCHPEGCFFARRISVLTLQLFGMADRKRDPSLRSG